MRQTTKGGKDSDWFLKSGMFILDLSIQRMAHVVIISALILGKCRLRKPGGKSLFCDSNAVEDSDPS